MEGQSALQVRPSGDDDELIARASAVLKSQGRGNWPRGRPGPVWARTKTRSLRDASCGEILEKNVELIVGFLDGWSYAFFDIWAMSHEHTHVACERNGLSVGRALVSPARCARHLLSGACA